MMAIRSIPKPAVQPCRCGGVMQPATRFEATQTVAVLCCWGCGAEDPPMAWAARLPAPRACRYCDAQFTPPDPRSRYCSDGCAIRADRIAIDRKRTGQQLRIARRRSA